MVVYTWETHHAYKTATIQEFHIDGVGQGVYGYLLDGTLYHTGKSIAQLEALIDDLQPEPDKYQPFGDYRGCTLFRYVSNPLYGSSCTPKRRDTLDLVRADIDNLLGPIPEPKWELKEIYNGLAIWFWPSTDEERGYYTSKAGILYGPYSTIQACRIKINEFQAEPKKLTDLTISVHPRIGTPPYDTTIVTELISNGNLLVNKTMKLYKNGSQIKSSRTDITGKAVFIDTVIDDASYYTYFAGDMTYEGCSTEEVT